MITGVRHVEKHSVTFTKTFKNWVFELHTRQRRVEAQNFKFYYSHLILIAIEPAAFIIYIKVYKNFNYLLQVFKIIHYKYEIHFCL